MKEGDVEEGALLIYTYTFSDGFSVQCLEGCKSEEHAKKLQKSYETSYRKNDYSDFEILKGTFEKIDNTMTFATEDIKIYE